MIMSTKSFQHHIHERPNLPSTTNAMRVDYGDGLKQPPTLATQADAPSLSASSSSSSPSPDPVPSGVPNPFLKNSTQVSGHHNNSNVQCINWGKGATTHNSNIIIHPTPHQVSSSQVFVPNPFQPINTHTNGSVTPPPPITALGTHEASPATPTSAQEMPMPVPQSMISNNIETMNPGFSSGSTPEGKSAGLNSRRQKRLERNRESARLSRRRRKQYLEVLEERVKSLSVEMDKGRREHVAVSVLALREKKSQELSIDSSSLIDIETFSTSRETRVAATFLTQQMNSLSLAPHDKFLLWLSMQNDSFFRGGRASSERLSAARIGERVSYCHFEATTTTLLTF
jgi:bZIP transcription factor